MADMEKSYDDLIIINLYIWILLAGMGPKLNVLSAHKLVLTNYACTIDNKQELRAYCPHINTVSYT